MPSSTKTGINNLLCATGHGYNDAYFLELGPYNLLADQRDLFQISRPKIDAIGGPLSISGRRMAISGTLIFFFGLSLFLLRMIFNWILSFKVSL